MEEVMQVFRFSQTYILTVFTLLEDESSSTASVAPCTTKSHVSIATITLASGHYAIRNPRFPAETQVGLVLSVSRGLPAHWRQVGGWLGGALVSR
ncbi:hypothetical protein E2C01_003152 [Portunus trituberculatus]|uniref:Uncharacterized protein n=1 Tax=Portunus trituberculatus TaxID=210409 RepID=A0A5B7CPG1_PORTR|nr:hypothetical protein [Portunus trituberculatus]